MRHTTVCSNQSAQKWLSTAQVACLLSSQEISVQYFTFSITCIMIQLPQCKPTNIPKVIMLYIYVNSYIFWDSLAHHQGAHWFSDSFMRLCTPWWWVSEAWNLYELTYYSLIVIPNNCVHLLVYNVVTSNRWPWIATEVKLHSQEIKQKPHTLHFSYTITDNTFLYIFFQWSVWQHYWRTIVLWRLTVHCGTLSNVNMTATLQI